MSTRRPRVLVQFRPYNRLSDQFTEAEGWGLNVAHHELLHCLVEHGVVEEVFLLRLSTPSTEEALAGETLKDLLGPALLTGRLHELVDHAPNRDLVFLDSINMLPRIGRVRALLGLPGQLIGILHSLPTPSATDFYYWLSAELESHDTLIATSTSGKRALETVFAAIETRSAVGVPDIRLIPLPMDRRRFDDLDRIACRRQLNLAEDALVLLTVGRFSETYKADLAPLVRVCQSLEASRRIVLMCAGANPEGYAARVVEWARACGFGSNVVVVTNFPLSLKPSLYGAADVFVSIVDNVQETFGLALLEAMAAGLPVVASDWSGYRDIVVPGRTGFLIETAWSERVADNVELAMVLGTAPATGTHMLAQGTVISLPDLRRALQMLVSDDALRHSLGQAGKVRAATVFDSKRIAECYAGVIAEKAAQSRLPSAASPLRLHEVYRSYATATLPRSGRLRFATPESPIGDAHLRLLLRDDKFRGIVKRLMARLQSHGSIALDELDIGPLASGIRAATWLVKHGACIIE